MEVGMKSLVIALFGTSPWVVGAPGAQPTGPLPEIMECAFREAHVPVTLKVVPMSRAFSMLQSGQVDAVAQGIRTPERDAQYVASAEVSRTQSGWFAMEGTSLPAFESLSMDVRRHISFGVLAGGAYTRRLVQEGFVGGVQVVGESDALLRMLTRGRFPFVYANAFAMKTLLATPEFSSHRVNFHPFWKDSGVVYFHKDSSVGKSELLLTRFNEGLRNCRRDGLFM